MRHPCLQGKLRAAASAGCFRLSVHPIPPCSKGQSTATPAGWLVRIRSRRAPPAGWSGGRGAGAGVFVPRPQHYATSAAIRGICHCAAALRLRVWGRGTNPAALGAHCLLALLASSRARPRLFAKAGRGLHCQPPPPRPPPLLGCWAPLRGDSASSKRQGCPLPLAVLQLPHPPPHSARLPPSPAGRWRGGSVARGRNHAALPSSGTGRSRARRALAARRRSALAAGERRSSARIRCKSRSRQ